MEQFFIFNKLENSLKSAVSYKHKNNYFSLFGSYILGSAIKY